MLYYILSRAELFRGCQLPIVFTSYDLPKLKITICDANPLLCDLFTYGKLIGSWTLQKVNVLMHNVRQTFKLKFESLFSPMSAQLLKP